MSGTLESDDLSEDGEGSEDEDDAFELGSDDDEDEDGDEDEEEEEDEGDAGKGAPSGKIQPRREDEFLCQSCFILKPMGQLADGETNLCVDCV